LGIPSFFGCLEMGYIYIRWNKELLHHDTNYNFFKFICEDHGILKIRKWKFACCKRYIDVLHHTLNYYCFLQPRDCVFDINDF